MTFDEIEQHDLQPNQGILAVMDRTGDTKIIWSRDNDDEITQARKTFDDLKAKGFVAYSVKGKSGGDKGEVVREFDPQSERLILVPPMKGG